jgi:hypothetical protein
MDTAIPRVVTSAPILTVAQLKAALADMPDDDPVLMILNTDTPHESAGWLFTAEHDPGARTCDLRGGSSLHR